MNSSGTAPCDVPELKVLLPCAPASFLRQDYVASVLVASNKYLIGIESEFSW